MPPLIAPLASDAQPTPKIARLGILLTGSPSDMTQARELSEESIQQVIRNAVARAAESLKGLDWFEMTEVRGLVKDGKVSQFQVKVKVGFRIMSEQEMRGA